MLRSTRKNAAASKTRMNTDATSALVRKGGIHTGLSQLCQQNHHPNSVSHRNENPFSRNISYSVQRTILSHLVTACTTALVVTLLCGRFYSNSNQAALGDLFQNRLQDRSTNLRTISRSIRQAGTISFPYFDLVVAGAGPAGLTASLFAARAGLRVLVVGSATGLLSEAESLDNFPSWNNPNFAGNSLMSKDAYGGGQAWLDTTRQQAAATGVHFATPGLVVLNITQNVDLSLSLNVSGKLVRSLTAIIATGSTGRKLGLPHEESLWGKSIHSCAICDGPSYRNKTVVVVGGGDAAVDAAVLLSRHALSVILVHRREVFRASNQRNIDAVFQIPTIRVKTPYILSQYLSNGEKSLFSGLQISNMGTNETEDIVCDGVFVMIGSTPNTKFLQGFVQLDKEGYVVRNSDGTSATSIDGIFAAGEASDNQYKQAITAAADGARAAIDSERWLRQKIDVEDMSSSQRAIPDAIPLQAKSNTGISRRNDQMNSGKVLALKSDDGGHPLATNICNDLKLRDCIFDLVHKYPVVVFSKSWCPYCKKALEALAVEGVTGEPFLLVVNLEQREAQDIQTTLANMTGRRTVPNVFVGGTSIGGGDETVSLQQRGVLHSLLLNANAIGEGGDN
jgi:thioredoxin reductase (NADPH)